MNGCLDTHSSIHRIDELMMFEQFINPSMELDAT
jgi:hypothetical protein